MGNSTVKKKRQIDLKTLREKRGWTKMRAARNWVSAALIIPMWKMGDTAYL